MQIERLSAKVNNMSITQATCETLFEAPTNHPVGHRGPQVELERWQWEDGKVHYILTTWNPDTQQWDARDIGKYIGPSCDADAVRFAATIYKCMTCRKCAQRRLIATTAGNC
jgi:hypothetical protein